MKNVGAALLLTLLIGCAQVRAPEGGPKDTEAPTLLWSIPANGSVNVRPDRIVLTFNEKVKLDRIRERLLVSPPMVPAPEVVMGRPHEVLIRLKAPLEANTTYVINIGEAVVDITENNAAAGLAFVFATGPTLDSGSVQGRISHAYAGGPAANIMVAAYHANDTNDLRRGRPAYATRSDAQGRYTLSHMRAGSYRIAALNDRNANLRYDLPSEEIAFHNATIRSDAGATVDLALFQERPEVQTVLEARVLPDRGWRIVFAKPAAAIGLSSLDRTPGKLSWLQEWNTDRDTLLLWPTDTTLLNGQRFQLLEDRVPLDSLTFRAMAPMPFRLGLRASGTGTERVLLAERPIARIDTTRLLHIHDSSGTAIGARMDSIRPRNIALRVPANASGELTALPGALTDHHGGTHDTLRIRLDAVRQTATGILIATLRGDTAGNAPAKGVLQLLDAQDKLRAQVQVEALPFKATWPELPAGAYKLRFIADLDGDGRWTPGNYRTGTLPEPVYHHPERTDLRAGWETEVIWDHWPL